jgi:hypothetical protein
MNIYFSEKSNLAKLVSVLDPDGECDDIQGLLGRACLVTLGFTSGGNIKITGFLPLLEGMEVPELENEATYFDRDNPDWDLFNSFPPFIKERLTVECLNVPEDWDLEAIEESQY